MSKTTTKKELINPITKEDLEAMINAQATRQEIISFYEGNLEALEEFSKKEYKLDFKTLYNRLIAKAKIDLRKQLTDIATNPASHTGKNQLLAIFFLSKCYLGLSEGGALTKGNMSNPGTQENKAGDSKEPAIDWDL